MRSLQEKSDSVLQILNVGQSLKYNILFYTMLLKMIKWLILVDQFSTLPKYKLLNWMALELCPETILYIFTKFKYFIF